MGVPSALRQVICAKEVTWATAVSGTSRMMNLLDASLKVDDTTVVIPEIGRLAPSQNAGQLYQAGSGMTKYDASYDDLPYAWDALFGVATPSTAGVTYSYTGPVLSVPTSPRIQTLEFGATGASYRMAGSVQQKFSLKIAAMGFGEQQNDYIGSNIATVQLSTGVSDRATSIIRAVDTTFYVDTSAGTVGTTVATATLIEADVSIDTKRHLKPFVGSLNPGIWGEGGPWQLGLGATLEFNATGKALADALLTGIVQRQMQLRSTGPSTGYISKINMGLVQTGGETLFSDRGGNLTVKLTYSGEYSNALGNFITATVANLTTGLA